MSMSNLSCLESGKVRCRKVRAKSNERLRFEGEERFLGG